MWLECIRYRFRLSAKQNGLELAQNAALESLRNSPRCRGWHVVPAPGDPTLSILKIEWDPGDATPFHGSAEFADLQAALSRQVRALEETDYRTNIRLLHNILGGPEGLFRLSEDIVIGVMDDPELAWRFHCLDGSKRGRLSLWLLESLGGPELFSSSFPDAVVRQGPLASGFLDLEERDRLLEVARDALPAALEEQGRCVIGTLRANLPLHPPPPSQFGIGAKLLERWAPAVLPARIGDSLGDDSERHQLALHTEAQAGATPRAAAAELTAFPFPDDVEELDEDTPESTPVEPGSRKWADSGVVLRGNPARFSRGPARTRRSGG